MPQRRPIILLSIVTAALAFAAIAAFGSGNASAGAEERAKGAVAVPATALAYASVNTDRSGAPWQALEALAAKVPGGAEAVATLNGRLSDGSDQAKVDDARARLELIEAGDESINRYRAERDLEFAENLIRIAGR